MRQTLLILVVQHGIDVGGLNFFLGLDNGLHTLLLKNTDADLVKFQFTLQRLQKGLIIQHRLRVELSFVTCGF